MKVFVVIAISFLSSIHCFAARSSSFDIKAEVWLNGKLVSKPHILAKANEPVSISQKVGETKEILIEMTAADYTGKDPKDGIMMRFTVSHNDAGKKTVISQSQIIALPGESAELSQDGPEPVKIKVFATRAP